MQGLGCPMPRSLERPEAPIAASKNANVDGGPQSAMRRCGCRIAGVTCELLASYARRVRRNRRVGELQTRDLCRLSPNGNALAVSRLSGRGHISRQGRAAQFGFGNQALKHRSRSMHTPRVATRDSSPREILACADSSERGTPSHRKCPLRQAAQAGDKPLRGFAGPKTTLSGPLWRFTGISAKIAAPH